MAHTIDRRTLLVGAAAAGLRSLLPGRASAEDASDEKNARHRHRGPVREFQLVSRKVYKDPFWDASVDVLVTGPGGRRFRVPAFWSGGSVWRWRFWDPQPGTYRYETIASDTTNRDLHGVAGEFRIDEDRGENPLFRRGPLKVSENRRYLEAADGTPFLWLGDTWWMGLTERLAWPDEFQRLAADRREKGFNVIQLVAGLYPDMDSFDPRGKNEAGYPWERGYQRIAPAWWDLAERRIEHLIGMGLVPCIVGCWGYYLKKIGMKKMQAHWRTIIARWGAWPVVWCLAGEGSMPWYLSERKDEERAELEAGWTEMARYVRRTDPFHRLITIHPSRSSRDVVRDPTVLDFEMLQTGHSDYRSIPNTLKTIAEAYRREPTMPVVEAEVCYEGIMHSCRQDIQRFMFWSALLNGCCGFTYGANGIWQVNQPGKPFGPSPHGRTWGNTPWQEAMNHPGSRQVGIGARFLRSLPWHQMQPHPEWVEPHWNKSNYHAPSAAGIPRKLRVIYTPARWNPPRLTRLEKGLAYRARLVNPSTGDVVPFGTLRADDSGECRLGHFPEQRDWVIVLEC